MNMHMIINSVLITTVPMAEMVVFNGVGLGLDVGGGSCRGRALMDAEYNTVTVVFPTRTVSS